jgi:hypothetical protein
MVRSLAAAVVLAGAIVHAQPSGPAFLADASPSRLDTRHLQAQADGPVRVAADGRAVVTVVVTPKAKMHVYAADVEGYVPFTAKVDPLEGVTAGKVTYPPSEIYVFPPTGESSRAYMKPFKVTQSLTVGPEVRKAIADGRTVTASVTVRYQACDDTVCYRPTTGTVGFEFGRQGR